MKERTFSLVLLLARAGGGQTREKWKLLNELCARTARVQPAISRRDNFYLSLAYFYVAVEGIGNRARCDAHFVHRLAVFTKSNYILLFNILFQLLLLNELSGACMRRKQKYIFSHCMLHTIRTATPIILFSAIMFQAPSIFNRFIPIKVCWSDKRFETYNSSLRSKKCGWYNKIERMKWKGEWLLHSMCSDESDKTGSLNSGVQVNCAWPVLK